MPLKKQILLVVAVVAGLLLLSLLGSFYFLTRIDDGVRQREANGVPHEAAMNFRYHVAQMQQFATDAAATGEKDSLKEADAHFARGNQQLDAIATALPAEKERVERIRALLKEFHDAGETMAQAYIAGGREAGNRIMKAPATGFDARAEALIKEFEPLLTQLASSGATLKEALLSANARGRMLLLVSNAMVLVVVLAALSAMAVRILNLLGGEPAEAVAATRRIADGDLLTPITGNPGAGSLLDAMRQMQAGLVKTVREVVVDAEQVARAASSLTNVAEELSQSSLKQADAAGSMATYVEQMSTSMEQVADNARTVHANALRSGELSGKGESDVQRTIEDMRQIAEAVHGSENLIKALDEHSKQIAAIVNVIRGIAEQTNLLALNAAIEAARAGEQGRGFAVVADEVRKLAERTSVSTEEITEMIDKIQSGTRAAVSSMENGVGVVSRGVEVATQAGSSMAAVRNEATGVARLVGDISDSIKEQTEATNVFAHNVESIAAMAETNSRSAHQGAAAAQELQQLADSLRTRISRFHV